MCNRVFLPLFATLALFLGACRDGPDEPLGPANSLAPVLRAENVELEGLAEDRFIVVLKEGSAHQVAEELARRHADTVRHFYRAIFTGFAADLSLQAVEALRRNPSIAYIEQDRPAYHHGSVMDLNAGWGLGRIDQRQGPSDGEFMNDSDGTGVNIYVVDSGIDQDQPDFGGRVVPAWTWDSSRPPGEDCNGHGTRVASVAAGEEYGVAKNATLYAVRANGCNEWQWVSDWTAGIDWVTANHIKPAVMNFSIGVENWVDDISPGSMNTAVKEAWNAGVFVTVSAGNENDDACDYSPANATKVFTVGSIDNSDTRASDSNYGTCLDLFAPGVNVNVARTGGGYGSGAGTSYAAPFAAGVAALWLDKYPSDSPNIVAIGIRDGATAGVINNKGLGSPDLLLYSELPVPLRPAIEGPRTISSQDSNCTWEEDVDGGRRHYTYQWSGVLSGTGRTVWGEVSQSGSLTLDVWDADGRHDSETIWITVEDPEGEEEMYCEA